MKSTDVYRVLREIVGPWAKASGFKRGPGGMLAYWRPGKAEAEALTFWFQCSQDGWDAYAGSKFTLELQRSDDPRPGAGRKRARVGKLLLPEERERFRMLQNQVISRLRRPPAEHLIFALQPEVGRGYLSKFEVVEHPYGLQEDVWMRYAGEADVRAWAVLAIEVLPALIERFGGGSDEARA